MPVRSTCAGSNITLANVTNITQSNLVNPSQAVTWALTYDTDGRITGVGGSLASINLPAAVSGNVYSAANQVTSWNGNNANNDTAKNLTLDPTNSAVYAWDERNQLSSVNTPSDYQYFYDALGRRETADNFGLITGYLYDDINVVEATGNNAANYLSMPGSSEVFAILQGSTTTVPLHDVLGSAIGLVNSSGSLATQYTYEPFGRPTTTGAASSFPYLFAGMEYDATTGLYHTPARYYSPVLQHFLSEDPLGHAAGDPNLFAYAGNDPVNFTDPSGLQYDAPGSQADTMGMASVVYFLNAAQEQGNLGVFGVGATLGSAESAPQIHRVSMLAQSNNLGISRGRIILAQAEGDDGGQEQDFDEQSEGAEEALAAGVEIGLAAEEAAEEAAVDEVIVAKNGTKIKGFTEHGIDRAIGDAAKRAGTRPSAILDALKNPRSVDPGVDQYGRPYQIFTGKDARVVINPQSGKVVSVNPLSRAGSQ